MWVHSCEHFELANTLIAYMSVMILNPVDISDALLHFNLATCTCPLYDFPLTCMNCANKEHECLAYCLCSFGLRKHPGGQRDRALEPSVLFFRNIELACARAG